MLDRVGEKSLELKLTVLEGESGPIPLLVTDLLGGEVGASSVVAGVFGDSAGLKLGESLFHPKIGARPPLFLRGSGSISIY
jgi:hypothetical protein